MQIFLASSSPRRQELLARLGLHFAVLKPAIDESSRAGEAPAEYAERLSREKAAAICQLLAGAPALIIAADTIVIDPGGSLLGKPADAADARRMLRTLRGRAHQVITAFTLRRSGPAPRCLTRHVCTTVLMRDYSDAEIAAYINSGDPFDKAGGYAIQSADFKPAARIDGSYSNVVGLPLEALAAALADFGLPVAPVQHLCR